MCYLLWNLLTACESEPPRMGAAQTPCITGLMFVCIWKLSVVLQTPVDIIYYPRMDITKDRGSSCSLSPFFWHMNYENLLIHTCNSSLLYSIVVETWNFCKIKVSFSSVISNTSFCSLSFLKAVFSCTSSLIYLHHVRIFWSLSSHV